MKKLMIAAVAAVVAGGVFAETYIYNFDATLKTTQGRTGTTTINLGADATGLKFWYEDGDVKAYLNDTVMKGGKSVPTIKNPSAEAIAAIKKIANKYNNKSAGQWCATFKVDGCYRVTGTRKIVVKAEGVNGLQTADCCGGIANTLVDPATNSKVGFSNLTATKIATPLFQRFGSLDPNKANKVELYAQVETYDAAGGQTFGGWLAGQGTMARKNGKDYVSTVSGNIVGTLPAPVCPNCCSAPDKAIAFDCAKPEGDNLLFTAGYGTFRLQINNQLTKF